jgi:cytochrome P450
MVDPHHAFFDKLNWFEEKDCEQLDAELAWARSECPVVRTEFDGGMYVITRYDDLRTVAEHPEVFSSAMPGVIPVPVALPPLDLDPPLHRDFRAFLNKYFSRAFLSTYRTVMEHLVDELVDGFIERGEVEFVSEFAIPFSAGSLARIVLDDKNEERVARAIEAVTVVAVTRDPASYGPVQAIARELLAERTEGGDHRDDFLGGIAHATVEDGRPLTEAEMLGVVTVLILGGLDTTRGAISYIGRFLAEQPRVEERMRRPEWKRKDLDEFLRFTSTVSVMGRVLTQDTELLGCPMKAGDRLAVHWRSGNRDESKFECPDELVFDRVKNPHAAFGFGIHRCLGQHFARLQLEIAFDRLLARVTNFRVKPGTVVREAVGTANRSPEELYLQFDRVPGTDLARPTAAREGALQL